VALDDVRSARAAEKILEPRLDHGALRFGVGPELLDSAADVRLELCHAAVEPPETLVPARLERGSRFGQAALEPLRAGIPYMRKALRKHGLGLACEHLHRPVELAGQSSGRVLATRLHERCELLRCFVAVGRRAPLDHARHLLDLAPLDILEAGTNACNGLGLLTLNELEQLALPAAQALVELV